MKTFILVTLLALALSACGHEEGPAPNWGGRSEVTLTCPEGYTQQKGWGECYCQDAQENLIYCDGGSNW